MFKKLVTYLMLLSVCLMLVAPLQGCGKSPVAPLHQTQQPSPFWSNVNQVADSLMANRLNDEQMDILFQQSAAFQQELIQVVASRQGMSVDQIVELKNGVVERLGQSKPIGPYSVTGACTQMVEYKTVVRDPIWASSYTSVNTSRGTEYMYSYYPWWSIDSDNIRWASNDGQVSWALWVSYGSLAGYNLCGRPFQLQTGNKGTWLAGGPDRVFRSLYAHHQ